MSPRQAVRPLRQPIPAHGVWAAERVYDPRFHMEARSHDFYEVYYLYRGRIAFTDESVGVQVELTPGTFYPNPPGHAHRIEDRSQSTLLLLWLGRAFVEQGVQHRAVWDAIMAHGGLPIQPDVVTCEQIERNLRRIMAEQARPQAGSPLAIQAEAGRLLVSLARVPVGDGEDPAMGRVRRIAQLMEETFYEPWDLETAARRAHLSRRRFSELFRAEAGESFLQRLTALRLEHAARLLGEGNQTIAGAAFASGFGDLSHFYRSFGRRYGVPPGQWQKVRNG